VNSQDLRDAAKALDAAAMKARARAAKVSDATWATLHRGVAMQLQDRANQVRMWADQADRTGSVTPEMKSGTDEFLSYAGL
jgi:hypothetical protein